MSYGDLLKVARLESGLSLSNVAARTRVRERLIQDLETEKVHSSGGKAYARGHIRTLARIYGADENLLLTAFDETQSEIEVSMSLLLEENNVTTSVEQNRPSWRIFGMVAGIVAFALLGFQIIPGMIDNGSEDSLISRVTQESKSSNEEAGPVAAATKGVSLILRAENGLSWVKAEGANGATIFEGKIKNGQSQSLFDDQLISLIIGNAGAISITYNGQELGAPGGVGEVVRLQFSPESQSAG
jgi:cytoskeletal protein RodZ